SSTISDDPITITKRGQKPWTPKNADGRYEGQLRMRVALGKSKNMVSIRILQMAGIDYVAGYLERFGFKHDQFVATEALALGAASFTPLEMARAYAVFDNGGFLIDPYIIERIEDSQGNELFKANPPIACIECTNLPLTYAEPEQFDGVKIHDEEQFFRSLKANETVNATETASNSTEEATSNSEEPVLDTIIRENAPDLMSNVQNQVGQTIYAPRVMKPEIAFLIRSALNSAIYGEQGQDWRGTSRSLANDFKRKDIGGKTGTTNQSKVTWYAGFGSNIVTTVYVGFDDNKRVLGKGESGARTAMPAWRDYMKVALADKKDRILPTPTNIVEAKIDATSGFLGSQLTEYFIKGTEPTKKFVVEQDILSEESGNPRDAGGGIRLGLPPKEILSSPSGAELF
ncbi:MAG: penicillin-binding transpeptidase domain-containing protein, partial [Haemophilus parahaemolyticus]|nr:penicillin-binding transpeptidase domain-containing protein [Haemophilus parahaemolyticus]